MMDFYELMEVDLHNVVRVTQKITVESVRPQTERLNELQVQNNAGGYSYRIDDKTRLLRYLVLGSDGGTYYCGENMMKRENVACIDRLIMAGRGLEVVDCIYKVSIQGRSCKQNSVLYALAVCARSNDPHTKTAAYRVLPEVCRIPTHLFQFIKYCENESSGTGWGRAHKRAVCNWYKRYKNEPLKLAYLVTKYRNRNDWSHKDVLRLAHIKTPDDSVGFVVKYLVKGLKHAKMTENQEITDSDKEKVKKFLEAVEKANSCTDENVIIGLIDTFHLAREHVPTEMLNSPSVWQALIWKMPMTAMIRNLGKMSSLELLSEGTENEKKIVKKLTDREQLSSSKIHPFTILIAWNQYKKGHGDKGSLKWKVNHRVLKALDDAFHLSFSNVEPTGKRISLAIDVSGSMNCPVVGNASVTAREASAAMMMLTARVESDFEIVAFSRGLTKLNINSNDSLQSVISKCNQLYFSMTDCSLPITNAIEQSKSFDVFIIYTDSETYYGMTHPSEALVRYRQYMGVPDAKLVVVGMASNGFSIADPNDPFMMDVVGFDTAAPQAIENFINNGTL